MSKFFLDGSKLYHHLDELQSWIEGKDFAPVHVEISPTNACNYRCTFCYADFTGHKNTRIEKDILLELMRDMGKAGVKSCLLAGDGEPTLVPYVKEAIAVGKAAGVDMALNTNARLFDAQWAEQTLPHLTWLRFSVMAATPKNYARVHGARTGDLAKTLDHIAGAVAVKQKRHLDVTLGIQQVFLPENAGEVLELAQIAKDLGVDYFVLKPFSLHQGNSTYRDGVSAVALRDQYMDQLRRAEELSGDGFITIIRWNTFSDDGWQSYDRCLGLGFIGQIAADAKIYCCCPFFYRDEYVYGDLHDQHFTDIWFGQTAQDIRSRIAQNLDVHRYCMSYCRHHQINRQLWQLKHPPAHVNFI